MSRKGDMPRCELLLNASGDDAPAHESCGTENVVVSGGLA